ncbi:MAG: hypothetical protein V4544_00235 [Pseudomonadota bacterium]
MSMPLSSSTYSANPLKFDPATRLDDDAKKAKDKEEAAGFSFKEFTNKFASKDAAPGMHNAVTKTTESQLDFAQKLLLKQLQCQTPDNSFDPNQMMESMMGMLTIAQNSELVSMQKENMELQKALFYTSLSTFEGETVEHSGNMFDYQNEDQEIVFNLPAKTEEAVLRIYAGDKHVRTVPLDEKKVGRNSVTWDGIMDNDDGDDVVKYAPKGIYTVFITARDINNDPIDVNTRLKSRITDIAYDENELALPMSGDIPIYDIKRRSMIKKATEGYQKVVSRQIQDASSQTMDDAGMQKLISLNNEHSYPDGDVGFKYF